jgi:N-acetylglucosaminyl-diphospho-decaprenol L-rhamnosyltransferase
VFPVKSAALPSVAAVIVHYRTPDRLCYCLDALERQTRACDDILVVDNSDAEDAIDIGSIDDRKWRLHRASTNLGFGAACDAGAAMTNSNYLLFLNADLVLSEDACEKLCAAVESGSQIAVVGPRIYGADGEIELSARSFPSLWTGILGRSSLLTKMLVALNRAPSGVSAALACTGPVDWVSGACMLIRREAFEQVGGFDEGYWMYWEDADICRRLKDQGWGAMVCTDAQAQHSTGSSGRSERTIRAFHSSAARYYERHVARTAVTGRLARGVLQTRMRAMLYRHARRPAN